MVEVAFKGQLSEKFLKQINIINIINRKQREQTTTMYEEVNAFFNRPETSDDDPNGVSQATRQQFLQELNKISKTEDARQTNQTE